MHITNAFNIANFPYCTNVVMFAPGNQILLLSDVCGIICRTCYEQAAVKNGIISRAKRPCAMTGLLCYDLTDRLARVLRCSMFSGVVRYEMALGFPSYL